MKSKLIESHIELHENALDCVILLISDKGEATEELQQIISQALNALEDWYEINEMPS
ncbi:hypothetical protein [Spirosoma flavum]|uniref:Uncharacterized protein n=1 Tax=Spirosoma flavum TaxID=2048557 RepID=A0ABW6AR59_9BACT